MLGETFEFVTENFRYLAEKISHKPKQVFCYLVEGKSYKFWGYQDIKPSVGMNYGKGSIIMT